ncbi:MAG: hypothetical protein QXN96_02280 [Candidatus Bathyarchaeia archaeon]
MSEKESVKQPFKASGESKIGVPRYLTGQQARELLQEAIRLKSYLEMTMESFRLYRQAQSQAYHGRKGKPSQGYIDGRWLWGKERKLQWKITRIERHIRQLQARIEETEIGC